MTYFKEPFFLKILIQYDFDKTKKCHFLMSKEVLFLTLQISWGLVKGSPFEEQFNIGYVNIFVEIKFFLSVRRYVIL